MDWFQDDDTDGDFGTVFKYNETTPLPTTVVLLETEDRVETRARTNSSIFTLATNQEWEDWYQMHYPRTHLSDSSLVLVMLRRPEERPDPGVKRDDPEEWSKHMADSRKTLNYLAPGYKEEPVTGGQFGAQATLSQLPITRKQFTEIAAKFHVHKSITRCFMRADAPAISAEKVMVWHDDYRRRPSYVYNCRTSNAWPRDLALTTTHFPHCDTTFAVMFGCSAEVEADIVRRLSSAIKEAAHPALLPGILIELERSRHIEIMENTIAELKDRFGMVNSRLENIEALSEAEKDRRLTARREAWFNIKYLESHLVSWNSLLSAFTRHLDELQVSWRDAAQIAAFTGEQEVGEREALRWFEPSPEDLMCRVNRKIRSRVGEIIHEYQEKIRECAMIMDGMVMAAQWRARRRRTITDRSKQAQGEMNVGIALSAARESRHMKSIAIVTMVFLPGTFFASIFSMNLFDWDSGPSKVVSGYFWIYAVITTVATAITLFFWWFFGVHRPNTKIDRAERKRKRYSAVETV